MFLLCVAKMSSFLGFERPDAGLAGLEFVLMRELNWEVKDSVEDEEMGFPRDRLWRFSWL